MNKKKIEIARKMHGDLLGLGELKGSVNYLEEPTASLSIYA
jgi:hypothetical protein